MQFFRDITIYLRIKISHGIKIAVYGRNVTYIISGAAGANLREPEYGNWANEYGMGFYGKTVYAEKIYHYYLVEIDGTMGTATFTAYSLKGDIIEQFTIQKFK